MDLNTLWFILIAILFTGFFILEGFDYGVGILLPFLSKDDRERRMMINTIGPFWDGNEVWMITAGGALFAAFPNWYATLFSGFYLALLLILVALIIRGVAFEFRSKNSNPLWRGLWDWAIFSGSVVPAILWGVAFANILRGVPIDGEMHYVGTFFDLLNPYALIAGVGTLTIFTLHGAIFLSLKAGEPIQSRAEATVKRIGPFSTIVLVLFVGSTYIFTDILQQTVNPGLAPILTVLALLATGWLVNRGRMGWGFVTSALTIGLATLSIFGMLFPRVMVSSLNPAWHLTIYNASSSPYTLQVMSIIALIFVPLVLLYQGWTYWVFRARITQNTDLIY